MTNILTVYKLLWVNRDGMPQWFASPNTYDNINKARSEACMFVSNDPKGIISVDKDDKGILHAQGYVRMKKREFVWTDNDNGDEYIIRGDGSLGKAIGKPKKKDMHPFGL